MDRMSNVINIIPSDRPLRIIGDVHGDAKAFAIAAETDRFIIQLGDLVDDGPDSVGALQIMFRLLDERRGLFILGNHDFKLARALRGDLIQAGPTLKTLSELPQNLHERTLAEIKAAPAWLQSGMCFFVHGAFHPAMLGQECGPFPTTRPNALWARALYGQTSGYFNEAGKPERLLRWVDDLPSGMTAYVGHDRRSADGRPYIRNGTSGGRAVFIDTGAGKGGHLSWLDIPPLAD